MEYYKSYCKFYFHLRIAQTILRVTVRAIPYITKYLYKCYTLIIFDIEVYIFASSSFTPHIVYILNTWKLFLFDVYGLKMSRKIDDSMKRRPWRKTIKKTSTISKDIVDVFFNAARDHKRFRGKKGYRWSERVLGLNYWFETLHIKG